MSQATLPPIQKPIIPILPSSMVACSRKNRTVPLTSSSISGNVQEFHARGLLESEDQYGGVPRAAIQQINKLFTEVEQGANPDVLKQELDRWGLFDYYQDRFLNLFRQKRV